MTGVAELDVTLVVDADAEGVEQAERERHDLITGR